MVEAITGAIAARLSDKRDLKLQEGISGSSETEGVAGAWDQAITEAYNQARMAVLTGGE